MSLRMAKPWRHPQSGIFWLRRRVPADLVAIVGKAEEKRSLRTRDPVEAKAAYIRAAAELEARWANLRKGVRRVSHKDATAIAGEIYRKFVQENEEEPGTPGYALNKLLIEQVAADSPGVKVIPIGDGPWVRWYLSRVKEQNRPTVEAYLEERGEMVDAESFERILVAVNNAMVQARDVLLRFAQGDYRPDPDADRFPIRQSDAAKARQNLSSDFYDLVAIYEKFAEESQHAMSTRKKWRAIIAEVAEDNADIRMINDLWCVGWKDRLLARGLSPRSVQYGYLAALRSTCAWAVKNKRIEKNPADNVSVKVTKAAKERSKGYTDDEAKFVLGLTRKPTPTRLSPENKAARRWVPWLCAYTGARVGEIAQLRKEDVQEQDGVWLLWITPEAGTVKDGNSRYVPIHPHLLDQGFLGYVKIRKPGPLFYSISRKRGGSLENPTSKKVGERLAAWIRDEGFTDKRVAPNHAWRHRFKTLSRRHKLDVGARDYIQGHVAATEGEEYGEFEPKVLFEEICKIPFQTS